MESFIKRALFLSGLALFLHCEPLSRASDMMIWTWNKAYEGKLIIENQELLKIETEVQTEEVKEAAPPTTIEETVPETTQLPTQEPTSEVQTEETTAAPVVQGTPLYSVNGHVLPAEIQVYLYNALAVRGIGWFYPYAILMAYQESNFNIYAENPNGLDKGLFQYRILYWGEYCAGAGQNGADIFNPYSQIEVFAHYMALRASWGCTVSDMISRHNMSDYGPYNQDYVNHVMSWEPGMIKIN